MNIKVFSIWKKYSGQIKLYYENGRAGRDCPNIWYLLAFYLASIILFRFGKLFMGEHCTASNVLHERHLKGMEQSCHYSSVSTCWSYFSSSAHIQSLLREHTCGPQHKMFLWTLVQSYFHFTILPSVSEYAHTYTQACFISPSFCKSPPSDCSPSYHIVAVPPATWLSLQHITSDAEEWEGNIQTATVNCANNRSAAGS